MERKLIRGKSYARQTIATYRQTIDTEGEGNPYLEALETTDEILGKIKDSTYIPLITDEQRQFSQKDRSVLTSRIENLFIAFSDYYTVASMIDSHIRQGYYSRNPLSFEQKKMLRDLAEQKGKRLSFYEREKATMPMLHLFGLPGTGKSTMVNTILSCYDQVIWHTEYYGQPLDNKAQIVWLRVEAPINGHAKALCRDILSAIDRVLSDSEYKTDYLKRYGHESVDYILNTIGRLATIHGIGIIAIDEFQRLTDNNSETGVIINFLTAMSNVIKIPIVLIGTGEARSIFKKFYLIRRIGMSLGNFDRMKQTDKQWKKLMGILWKLQYVKNPGELTREIEDALYYETQGVLAVVLTLFQMTQRIAILSKKETVTPELIEYVSRKHMYSIRDTLKGFRDNNPDLLIDYSDLASNLSGAQLEFQSVIRKLALEEKPEQASAAASDANNIRQVVDKIFLNVLNAEIIEMLSESEVKDIISEIIEQNPGVTKLPTRMALVLNRIIELEKERSDSKKSRQPKEATGLLAVAKSENVYDALQDSGYIEDGEEI